MGNDVPYAAQVAIQGLGQMGEGLRQSKDDRANKKLGELFMAQNPDPDGQFQGESLRLGQSTADRTMQIKNQGDAISPQSKIISIMQKIPYMTDPVMQKQAMQAVVAMTNGLEVFAKQRSSGKGGGKGGGSSGGDGNLDTGQTTAKEIRRIYAKRLTARTKLDKSDPQYLTFDQAEDLMAKKLDKLQVNEAKSVRDFLGNSTTRTTVDDQGEDGSGGSEDNQRLVPTAK